MEWEEVKDVYKYSYQLVRTDPEIVARDSIRANCFPLERLI